MDLSGAMLIAVLKRERQLVPHTPLLPTLPPCASATHLCTSATSLCASASTTTHYQNPWSYRIMLCVSDLRGTMLIGASASWYCTRCYSRMLPFMAGILPLMGAIPPFMVTVMAETMPSVVDMLL
eukprot:768223-Rhodomonas_salina.1